MLVATSIQVSLLSHSNCQLNLIQSVKCFNHHIRDHFQYRIQSVSSIQTCTDTYMPNTLDSISKKPYVALLMQQFELIPELGKLPINCPGEASNYLRPHFFLVFFLAACREFLIEAHLQRIIWYKSIFMELEWNWKLKNKKSNEK